MSIYVHKKHVNEEILNRLVKKILDRADRYAPNSNFYLTDYEKVRFANVVRALLIEMQLVVSVNQGHKNEGMPGEIKCLK